MSIQIKLNTKELEKAFKNFPDFIAKETRLTLKKGSRDIVNRARETHKYTDRTGRATSSINWEYQKDFQSIIGLGGRKAPYAKYLHDGSGIYAGHKKYEITTKKKKALRFVGGNGKFVFSKKVIHSGIKKDEFLFRAAKAIRPRLKKEVRNSIEKAARRAF